MSHLTASHFSGSHLSLYRPEQDDEADEPVILPFDAYYQPETINFQQAVQERARHEFRAAHHPQTRPQCQSVKVQTVTASVRRGGQGFQIMGTQREAREFSCQCCRWNWKSR